MTRFERFRRRKSPGRKRDEWYTPPELVKSLGLFDLDPSAGPDTRHARHNWTKRTDGLSRKWFGRVWLNPPFLQRKIWSERLAEHGNGILLLNAAGLEARWLQEVIARSSAILFCHRRINFRRPGRMKATPPSGQILIAFGARNQRALFDSGIVGMIFESPVRNLTPRSALRVPRSHE